MHVCLSGMYGCAVQQRTPFGFLIRQDQSASRNRLGRAAILILRCLLYCGSRQNGTLTDRLHAAPNLGLNGAGLPPLKRYKRPYTDGQCWNSVRGLYGVVLWPTEARQNTKTKVLRIQFHNARYKNISCLCKLFKNSQCIFYYFYC